MLRWECKEKLVKLYGKRCYYCNQTFDLPQLTLDHIYPVSKHKKWRSRREKIIYRKRSFNNIGNLILSCRICNELKDNRVISIEAFRKERMGISYHPYEYKVNEPITKERKEAQKKAVEKARLVGIVKVTQKPKRTTPTNVYADLSKIEYPKEVVVLNRTFPWWKRLIHTLSLTFSS
jgi:hypothetical protein